MTTVPITTSTPFKDQGFELVMPTQNFDPTYSTLDLLGSDQEYIVQRIYSGSPRFDEYLCLRFDSYALRNKTVDPKKFPDGRERDGYDPFSAHYGLFSGEELIGCFRLVPAINGGFVYRGPGISAYLENSLEVSRFCIVPGRHKELLGFLSKVSFEMVRDFGKKFAVITVQRAMARALRRTGAPVEELGYSDYHLSKEYLLCRVPLYPGMKVN